MSKRQRSTTRGASTSRGGSRQIPSDPDYPDIIFRDELQRKKFLRVKVRLVLPSRFFCHASLQELGLFNAMSDLCSTLNFNTMFNMYYNSHPDLVYEFLSSCEETVLNDAHGMSFRLLNIERFLSYADIGQLFGLDPNWGTMKGATGQSAYIIWRKLTGKHDFDPKHLTIASVHHPVLRIFLKFLSTTLFARHDHSASRLNHIAFLAHALKSNADLHYVLPMKMVKHLTGLNARPVKSELLIGGIVTRIAVHYGYVDSVERHPDALLSTNFLKLANYITDHTGPVLWHVGRRSIVLPSMDLPPLSRDLPHYLLFPPPGFVVEEEYEHLYQEDREEEEDINVHHQPHNPPPYPSNYSHFQRSVMDQFSQMNARFDDVTQRMSQLEIDQRRAFEPIYGQFYQTGVFPQGFSEHPSWFDPSRWGGPSGSGAGGSDE